MKYLTNNTLLLSKFLDLHKTIVTIKTQDNIWDEGRIYLMIYNQNIHDNSDDVCW
jgi:hypothetical protein